MNPRLNILFLCTGNSCRSQMAEGWAKHLKPDSLKVWSAGIEKHGLNPLAVEAMAEAGVDISQQASKTIAELPTQDFDYIVTLCGHANETCPLFPGKVRRVHVGFDDPPTLAANAETQAQALAPYQRVRDEIRGFIAKLPESLAELTQTK